MALEARYKKEEVGYPVIWEKTKESSDVVDYNINKEITKDASATENANNQTTTGMASVVPWINSPKLIASTSIIWPAWARIQYISDYKSADEWQPVVDRVLNGEFVCVRCIFKERSGLQNYFFIPYLYLSTNIRFMAVYPWFHWFDIICWLTDDKVTSVTTDNWTW